MTAAVPLPDERRLAALLQEAAGLRLPEGGLVLAIARLAPRLRRLGLDRFDDYLALLDRERGGELQMALDLLTTPDACFFREPEQFELLEAELSRQRPMRLRLWSVAAAFGDEAYSLAMLLGDLQRAGRIGADWSVLGTDIGANRLQAAATGLYAPARLRQVTPERLQRYCVGGATPHSLVQVQAALRERVRFEAHDLREPLAAAVEPFDVILLRGALAYFDAATRQTVVDRVMAQLRPGGLFIVGAAEAGLVGEVAGLEALGGGAFRLG